MQGALLAVAATLLVRLEGAELDAEALELARMVRDGCIEDVGVDPKLLAQVDGGADLIPDDKFKCYLKCTMETAGMMAEGTVDVEAVLALLPDEISARSGSVVRTCGTQTGADDCDTAFRTQSCWQQGNRDDYIFV